MTIDDPYGRLTNLAVRDLGNTKYSEYGTGYKDQINDINKNKDESKRGKDDVLTWDDFDISVVTSRSGEIESESQDKFKVSSKDKEDTKFCDWWKGPIVGKSEYSIREETIEKKR